MQSKITKASLYSQWQVSTCVIHLLTLKNHFAVAKIHFNIVTTIQSGGNMSQNIKQCHGDLPPKALKMFLNRIRNNDPAGLVINLQKGA